MGLADFPRIDDFGDAAAEARACRNECALFDFSFLECARLKGAKARYIIETFTGRSLAAMDIGQIYYALRVDPAGTVVTDLTVWRTDEDSYDVMSGRHEDIVDLLHQAQADVAVTDVTNDSAVFALQGPNALEIISSLGDTNLIGSLRYFSFVEVRLNGATCRVGRLGYTGEAGFEIILPRTAARESWHTLSRLAQPGGFIAADMLRIEAGFVLFCNEFSVPVSPREAGVGRFYHPDGLDSPELTLISFRADADALRLPWQPSGDLKRPVEPDEIVVTSACQSNAAGGVLGLGYVRAGTALGARLHDPTGTFGNIRRTPLPFYDPAKRRPRAAWR
jgi:glycine cleavage system T protein (aminomethyltransferase)